MYYNNNSRIQELKLVRGQKVRLHSNCSRIMFVRKGKIEIQAENELVHNDIQTPLKYFETVQLEKNTMLLLLPNTTYKMVAEIITRLLIVEWDNNLDIRQYFQFNYLNKLKYENQKGYSSSRSNANFVPLGTEKLETFLREIEVTLMKLCNPKLFHIKIKQLFILMGIYYTDIKLCEFFYRLLVHDLTFPELVNKNALKAKTVKELIAACKINESTFNSRFFATFGTTPLIWLKNIRAEIIKNDLTYSGLTLSEICEKYGFSSSQEFYNYCRRQYGILPKKLELSKK